MTNKLTKLDQQGVIAPLLLIILVVILAGGYLLLQGNGNFKDSITQINKPKDSSSKTETSPSSEAKVTITTKGFIPATLTVAKGQQVTWINTDSQNHQIVIDTNSLKLDSDTLETKDSYSYTFDTTGTYSYHDPLNPKLKATIIVK